MTEFLTYIVPGIAQGFVYIVVGLGFVLLWKCSRIANLGIGELVVLGAYMFYAFRVQLGLPILVAFLGVIVFGVILGLVIGRFVMRPLIGQGLMPVAFSTLAIASVLSGIMILTWGAGVLKLPLIFPSGGIDIGSVAISNTHVAFLATGLAAFIVLTIYFKYFRFGLSMMATADDQQLAQGTGIKVSNVVSVSLVLAIVLATIGGILLTSITGIHYSATGFGMIAVWVALVGGLESFGGLVVAGLLVGAFQGVSAGYLDPLTGGGFSEIAAYVLMVIVLLIRPYGLFGWKKVERV